MRTTIILTIMLNVTHLHAAADWKQWETLRWTGLESYRKGDLEAAKKSLEAALQEAQRQESAQRHEVISTLDLCRLSLAAGDTPQAETYGKKALELGRKSLDAKSPELTQVLLAMVEVESTRNNPDEVAKLDAELDARADASPEAGTIGAASMGVDGTLSLQLRAGSPDNLGDGLASYPVNHPRYREVLMHIGPLRPGETRLVSPWK